MNKLNGRKFEINDMAVLYVTTCSDIEPSYEHSRRFLECRIVGIIPSWDKERHDERYIIRCSEDLRDKPYEGGLYAYEALVSVHSPFLFAWDEFLNLKNNPKALQEWLDETDDLLMGYNIPSHMQNWQYETCRIMLKLGIDEIESVVDDIRSDFVPAKMKVIR